MQIWPLSTPWDGWCQRYLGVSMNAFSFCSVQLASEGPSSTPCGGRRRIGEPGCEDTVCAISWHGFIWAEHKAEVSAVPQGATRAPRGLPVGCGPLCSSPSGEGLGLRFQAVCAAPGLAMPPP